jgi:hypothetical protein
MNTNSINAIAQDTVFRFILKSKGAIQKVTKEALIEIGKRLVYYSAVGDPSKWQHPPHKNYVPGHFINNWQLGVDVIPVGEIPGVDPSGTLSIERMTKSIPRWPVGHVYYFVNNVAYARLLETGEHSRQVPPGGMVGRTVLEYPEIVRQAEINYAKDN